MHAHNYTLWLRLVGADKRNFPLLRESSKKANRGMEMWREGWGWSRIRDGEEWKEGWGQECTVADAEGIVEI